MKTKSYAFIAFATLFVAHSSGYAAEPSWKSNAGNTTWSAAANWVSGVAPSNSTTADTVLFNQTSYTSQPNYGTTGIAGIRVGDGSTATASLTLNGTALSLGTSGVTINGNSGTVTLSNAVKLDGNQTWTNNSNSLFTVNATVTNSGNTTPFTLTIGGLGATTISGIISNGGSTGTTALTKVGSGALVLSGNNTYNGTTTVNDGTLTLSGANGTLALSATPISLTGGLLRVGDGSLAASTNNNNRIADTQAINLSGGSFALLGTGLASTPTTETLGAITQGAGSDSISVKFGSTNNATLTAASFIHTAGNAATLVNGVSLGKDTASTTSVGRFLLTTTPTLVGTTAALSTGINSAVKNTQIVPYLVGEATLTTGGNGTANGVANTFLTYNATTGLRPLNLTDEFTQNAITTGNNTRITSNTTASTGGTINSLVMNNTVVGGNLTITDGQTLTNTSGAILFFNSNAIKPSSSTGTLAFGAAEAMVSVNGAQTGTISAPITGSGGLTKSGLGILALSGANSYTGNTTVAAGILSISGTGSLPSWNTAGGYTVASGATLAVGNMVTDGNITTMLGTNNFAAGSSLGFDTTAGNRTYTTTLNSTLGLAKIGANKLTLGSADSTVAGVLLDGAGTLELPGNVTTTSLNLQNSTGAATTTGAITIASGKTLTVNGPVRAGNVVNSYANNLNNTYAISGGTGTLAVNSATSDFTVGDAYQSAGVTQTLDMSALGTFTATLSRLKVGYGENSRDTGVLKLANTNTITAKTFEIGSGVTGSGTNLGRLDLGASNTFNVDVINVGGGVVGQGGIMFASSGTVTIRGSAGGSSTAVLNESFGASSTGNFTNQVDFTGGVLDARFGTSTVGQDGGNQQVHSSVLAIGQTSGAGADFSGGTLTIGKWNASPGTAAATKIPGMVYIGTATGTATMAAGAIKLADISAAANTCNATGTYVSGILTIGQNASVAATSILLGQANDNIALTNAAVNLNNGGTLTIGAGGLTTAKYETKAAASTLSFDGGVLKASSAGSLVGSGNGTLANVTVLSGGATIDSNGYNVSIDQAITAGVGNGLSTLTVNATGSGYIVAPYVQITDATGTGASAFAKINSAGRVTSIVVTNAGQNYSSTPTITLQGVAGSAATANYTLASVTGGGLTKTGNGTLTLSAANTYTGATTISAGTLQFSKIVSLYNGTTASWTAANLSVSSGATLALNVGGTGEFSTENATTLLTNLGALGGAVNNNGLQSGSVIGFDTSNAANSTFTIADAIANSTGTGGGAIGLSKLGNGTLTLSGNNTYTGSTTINAGTLTISGGAAIANTGAVTLANTAGALFQVNATETIGSLQGGGSTGGNVAIAAGQTLTVAEANTNTFAGAITGSGALQKTGAGTLALSGANTYTGSTTVSAGNITISNASALGGTGTGTTVANGAALQIQGDIAVGAEALNLAGSGFSNAGALRNLSGTNSLSGAITLSGATTIGSDAGALTLSGGISGTQNLTLTGAGNTTISGAIATSTGTLTKNGSGTATLSAANTYSGSTTVNAGTLNAAAANALGNSSVINVNGGSFLVTASNAVNDDAAINLNGGTLAIGGGVGEVVGALTLSGNSTIDMNGVGNSWISFASLTTVLDNSNRLEVWNYTPGSDAIYFQDQTNLANSLNYISFYSGAGTGTFYNALNTSSFSAPELYATVVPEPSTYIAAALLLGGLCVQYLRRTRYKAASGRS